MPIGNNQYTAQWTKEEIEWIINKYPHSTFDECENALPGRTLNSIKHKASRMGIKKNGRSNITAKFQNKQRKGSNGR